MSISRAIQIMFFPSLYPPQAIQIQSKFRVSHLIPTKQKNSVLNSLARINLHNVAPKFLHISLFVLAFAGFLDHSRFRPLPCITSLVLFRSALVLPPSCARCTFRLTISCPLCLLLLHFIVTDQCYSFFHLV